jgi:hypothetical protein
VDIVVTTPTTRFDLVVTLRAAKPLGLAIPRRSSSARTT